MVERPLNERSPLAIGLEWSARITTVGFEIALFTAAGWWLDRRWGARGWLLIAGSLLGIAVGGLHFVQMVIGLTRRTSSRDQSSDSSRTKSL